MNLIGKSASEPAVFVQIFMIAFCFLFSGPASAGFGGEFTLKRVERDLWSVKFCFDEPIEILGFERPIAGFRKTHWRAATPGMVLSHTKETAQIATENGDPFKCAEIEVQTYTEMPPKNYYAFSPYSDGGMSVYTGYYTGTVYKGGEWHNYDLKARYVSLEGENVVARDPGSLGHQYVYFGPQEILRSPGAVLVIDPAFPAAAREAILGTVPVANQQLAQLFSLQPDHDYLVFLAAGEIDAFEGYSSKGGVQDDQILFTLKGREVPKLAARQTKYFAETTVHEVVHLWQRDVWAHLGADHAWVHEGSADALAYEIMFRAGTYTKEELAGRWQFAERECIKLLAKSSLREAPAKGNFGAVYRCGAFLNYIAGSVLNRDNPGQGILEIWAAMASEPEATRNRRDSEGLFFDTLGLVGVSPEITATMKQFINGEYADPASGVKSLKALVGLSS